MGRDGLATRAACAVTGVVIVVAVRVMLVCLFLPFSALDKLLNFKQAIGQASQAVAMRPAAMRPAAMRPAAMLLIAGGFCLEVGMSAAILSGIADRLAALVMAGYCVLTALLWKQFWKAPDFRLRGVSQGRDIFWDFLKNVALGGGFLLLTFGTDVAGVRRFLAQPLASSHPYRAQPEEGIVREPQP